MEGVQIGSCAIFSFLALFELLPSATLDLQFSELNAAITVAELHVQRHGRAILLCMFGIAESRQICRVSCAKAVAMSLS